MLISAQTYDKCTFFLFVDPGGVVLDEEGSSNTSLLSYSNVPEPTQENNNNTTTNAPENTSPSAELLASASSDVVEVTPAWESVVDMETPVPPVSPTPSSQYHSPTSTVSVSANGVPGNGVPNNGIVPGLEDPIDYCTFPSADAIIIGLFNTDEAVVIFNLASQNQAVCRGAVYGVRLAKWDPNVTSGHTVHYNRLQWGRWEMGGAVPDKYFPDQDFITSHTDVALNEAYYAQVAIGREEDFIDNITAPNGSTISGVSFIGTQGTL